MDEETFNILELLLYRLNSATQDHVTDYAIVALRSAYEASRINVGQSGAGCKCQCVEGRKRKQSRAEIEASLQAEIGPKLDE